MVHKCKYCGKVCSTSRGLTQHIQAKEACRNQQIAEYTSQVATDGQVQENDEGHTAEGLRRSKRHKRDATNDQSAEWLTNDAVMLITICCFSVHLSLMSKVLFMHQRPFLLVIEFVLVANRM